MLGDVALRGLRISGSGFRGVRFRGLGVQGLRGLGALGVDSRVSRPALNGLGSRVGLG